MIEKRRIGGIYKVIAVIGVVAVWLCSVYAVRGLGVLFQGSKGSAWGELATILFGAASVALFIFSILIALSAVVGWKAFQDIMTSEISDVAEKKVNDKVEAFRQKFETTNEKMKALELEMKGRALATQGYILGQLSIPGGQLFPEGENKGRLVEAVSLSRQAYEILQKVSEPAEYLALNNLVLFSCALDLKEGETIVEQAGKLLAMGVKKNNVDLQLTGCRAILQYSPDSRERARALSTLHDLIASPNTTQGQRAEADLIVDKLSEARRPEAREAAKGSAVDELRAEAAD